MDKNQAGSSGGSECDSGLWAFILKFWSPEEGSSLAAGLSGAVTARARYLVPITSHKSPLLPSETIQDMI